MLEKTNFHKNLYFLRKQFHNIGQDELAKELHCTRQTISAWEQGGGNPTLDNLLRICDYFEVPIVEMLYVDIAEVSGCAELTYEPIVRNTEEGYIRGICESGLYTIIDEDLEVFWDIVRYDTRMISLIAVMLHRKGNTITEVFGNGFSIVFHSDEEAQDFQRTLYDIIDSYLHFDDEYLEKWKSQIGDIISASHWECANLVMKEIFGKDINSFAYFWVDDMENPRGYADSEEECRTQAKLQGCLEYTIHSNN